MSTAIRRSLFRYGFIFVALAIVVALGRYFDLNHTAMALIFLIGVLFASAYWGLRYAIVLSIVATASFNFFFLPPLYTFTIADPQNWFALVAFLVTALVAGRLSERLRKEKVASQHRRHEVERLYALSQQLLTTEGLVSLLNTLPRIVTETFRVSGCALLVNDRNSIYVSKPELTYEEETLRAVAARADLIRQDGDASYVPLRVGVKTIGSLTITGGSLSRQSLEAIGSLVGLSIERARALEQLTLHRAAQESEKLRSALLDSVAHEFRTPLTGIKASVTSLLSTPEMENASRKELLTVIDEETDRLNRLVGEASEMAQLDAGMFKLKLEPHEIRDVIDPVIEATATLMKKHSLTVEIANGLPQVNMDVERIREVVTHLLENAAKYSPEGTPVRITAERQGNRVVISVSDKGPGIDGFEQPLIFEKFYRGRNQQYATHGTGMGLAIAKVIVEAHGGSINVVSQPGAGSVFSVYLPTRS